MKKKYIKADVHQFEFSLDHNILDGTVTATDGNAGIGYGGGSSGGARVKDRGVYGDLWADSEPDDYVADNEEEFIEE